MKKVLVIDNYDSFVYNLVQYFGELGAETIVWRNDKYSDDQVITKVQELAPTHILISPGPGKPCDSGISQIIVQQLKGKYPILGVCLGHQLIAELHGGKISIAAELMHGKTSIVHQQSKHSLFKEIPNSFTATRYHSLLVEKESFTANNDIQIEAQTEDGVVMALSHKKHLSLVGVQYHPESILSEYGHKILDNFLNLAI